MEDITTGPESDRIEPVAQNPSQPEKNPVSRLSELEEEVKKLRDQLSQNEPAAAPEQPEAVVEPPTVSELEPETHVESTPEQIEEAENLVRQARLAFSRKQNSQALDLLRKASEVAPNSVMVLQELGDSLASKNRWKEAQTIYGRASKLEPNNIVLERKYAEAILHGNMPAEAFLAGGSLSSPEVAANAKAAAIMSFLLPGVGQLVLGQTIKGVVVLVSWLTCLAIAFFIPHGIEGLIALASPKRGVPPNYIVLLPICMAILLCLFAMYDALSVAKVADRHKVGRPKPPVDLPFE